MQTGACRRTALTAMSGFIALLAAVLALSTHPAAARAAFVLPVTGPADAPRMVFNSAMTVNSICLPVTNPAGGQSVLYGQRFTDGPVTAATPAIVLVHGIASSTQTWDFSPTWSVARALASAGYVVYSYDRLGYAQSSYYSQPGGGYSLTTEAHRQMLHDVVNDVKTAGYGVTTASNCAEPTSPGTMKSSRVVVIGHSAGGWVVSGYPGEYHDVAAMVEADISGSAGGSASAPLGGNSQGGGFTPDPAHPDYFQFFQSQTDCYEFNTYTPGVVAYAAQIACTPPYLDSPYGEIGDLPAKYAQDDAYIAQIGPSIPVLLTSGEEDTTDPPSSAQADLAYYQAHCGCDVSQLLFPDTAHLFMVHRSLAEWVDDVVNWLSAHGISGTPSSTAGGGSRAPGARCAPATGRLAGISLGPIRLGMTRAAARRALSHFIVTRNGLDNFCLAHGWGIRAGYPSARLLRSAAPGVRRRIAGRVLIALSANRRYALAGVRPGARVWLLPARIRRLRPVRIGRNDWYVIPASRSDGLLKVQRGRVQEVGILARELAGDRAAQRQVLTSFPDA
jgi:pimeloyl-ACP methyl ester carboxylesterase